MRNRLIIAAVALNFSAQAQTFSTRAYSEDNGLQQKFIFSIDQDQNGVLYLGTESGIISYNGDYFSQAASVSGLAEKQVAAVLTDSNGVIWAGHFQSGVSCITHGVSSIVDSSDHVRGRINSLSEDAAGNVWGISQGRGLFRIDPFTRHITLAEGGALTQGKVLALHNHLYVASESGLRIYEPQADGSVHLQYVLSETQNVNITALCRGNLFGAEVLFVAGDGAGIFYYVINGNQLEYRGKTGSQDVPENIAVSAMVCDENNTLWIGSMGDGLFTVKFGPTLLPEYTERLNESNGLIDNNVQSLLIDLESNLWIGTFGSGLVQIPNSVFRYFTITNGLARSEVNCVVKDAYGTLWIGTNSGLTEFTPGVKTVHYDSRTGFADVEVTAVVFDTSGTMWIGTAADGIFVRDPLTQIFVNISKRFGLESQTVSGIVVSPNGLIYAGTSDGLYVFSSRNSAPAYFTTLDGLAHNNITQMHADAGGNVWFASKGSPPYMMHDGKINVVNDITNMQSYVINAMCEDNSGKRWVSTDGDGVFSFTTSAAGESRRIESYSMNEGLRSDHCIGVTTDDSGMLWVVHKGGVSVKFPDDSFFYSFGGIDNNLFDAMNGSIYADGSGTIYFCSDKGLIEVKPITREYLRRDPKISLAALFIDGTERTPSDRIELSPGSYNMTFEFNSILLGSNRHGPFFYRIIGADTVWRSALGRNIVIPQLSSGNYVLQVLPSRFAAVEGGTPLSIRISIDYPFWQKTWFIVAMILIVPLIIYGIIRMRTKSLMRLNHRLHILVQEKTFLLQTEKESVARINVELEEKRKDMTDSIHYAKRIQLAILPDLDMLKRNLADSFVYYEPRDIVSGDFYWFAEHGDLFFIAVADCTGHGVPGAFMSMIGSTLINKVVFDLGYSRPSEIMKSLNSEIKLSLHQQESMDSSHDGMDVAFCVIDKKERVLRFAGAGRPLLHMHNGTLYVHKTNKGGLGGVYNHLTPEFEEVIIPLVEGDSFYIYTDGFTDQFGGAHERKYSSPAFRGLVSGISNLPMKDQEKHIREAFTFWKGSGEQCDDVLVVGFRV